MFGKASTMQTPQGPPLAVLQRRKALLERALSPDRRKLFISRTGDDQKFLDSLPNSTTRRAVSQLSSKKQKNEGGYTSPNLRGSHRDISEPTIRKVSLRRLDGIDIPCRRRAQT